MPGARRILVTPRALTITPHPAMQRLENAGFEIVYATAGELPDEAELLRLVPECVGWIAGVEPVSKAVIAAAGHLRAVSRNGVGVDNLPLEFLRERGVRVRTADGANAQGVAELTIGLMLCALRHIPAIDAGIKAGRWPRERGRELHARTIGIVGCGAVGRCVAGILAAFQARVVAYDPMRPDIGICARSFRYATLDEVLSRSELVTLHCPPPANGRALIGTAQLRLMRQGAILVNAARASLIDEDSVLEALDDRRLDVYATDVFEPEPPSSLALAGHPNVVATSHLGAFTKESIDRATELAVDHLLEVIAPQVGHAG